MGKFIKLAWRNMWRNWRRTAIAMIAIVLGLVFLIFMQGMIDGSDQAMYGNAVRLYGGNIQIHAPGYRDNIKQMPLLAVDDPDMVVETALSHPQVIVASKRINTAGMVSSRSETYPVLITGIEPSAEAPISLVAENITQGRFMADADVDAILIGKGLAELLEAAVGDNLTLVGRRKGEAMRQHTMTVVGIYSLGLAEAEKGTVFINLADAQTLYNLRDQVSEVVISLDKVGQEDMVVSDLSKALPSHEVDSWITLKPEIRDTMDMKSTFTSIFGFVVLLVASIGILNIMMMAVFERTREMGVLASLGMKGRQLIGLFLLEGIFIGAVGSVIGCVVGWLVIIAIAQVGYDISYASEMGGDMVVLMGDTLYPSISLGYVISVGILTTIIAALASLYPAWQASRKEPAEALHYI